MAILVQTFKSAQAIANSSLVEGRAVKLTTSGQRGTLPTAVYASANDVIGVYIAFFPVDNFSRPTPRQMYTAPYWRNFKYMDANQYSDPVESSTYDRIPRSMWKEPTVYSGELVALHSGRVGLTAGAFIDSAAIKVPGSWVRVGASGMLQTTSTAAEVVGVVETYDAYNGVLYVTLSQ